MHEEVKQRWKELAAEAVKEQDLARLLKLVHEINKLTLDGQPNATTPPDAFEFQATNAPEPDSEATSNS